MTTLPQNFDFRASLAFVTDPANCQASTDATGTYLYPQTAPSGMIYGYVSPATGLNWRDRSATINPRLAGVNYCGGTDVLTWRADLPAPGTYPISLALGDDGSSFTGCQIQFFDGATLLATIGPINTTAGAFADATGTIYTAAAWPGSNTPVNLTFAGTELLVVLGSGISGSHSAIAYLGIGAASGTMIAGFGSSIMGARGRGALTGTGALKGTTATAVQAKSHLAGVGALEGRSATAVKAHAVAVLHGALAGYSRTAVQGQAHPLGTGKLSGRATAASQGRGALSGAGTLFGLGRGLSTLQGRAELTGTGKLAGHSLVAAQGQANPTGHGTLAGFGRGLASLQGHAAPTIQGALTGYSRATAQARAHPAGVGALAGHSLAASQGHGTLTGAGQLQGWGRAMAAVFGTGVLIPIGIYGQYPPWPPDEYPETSALRPSIVRPQQRVSVVSPQRRIK